MKICIKCGGLKPLDDYYKHSRMADGHLNACKECCKSAEKNHRKTNGDAIRERDRERGSRATPEYQREYKAKYPAKHKAHMAVERAVRKGVLVQQPCEICGSINSVAHHDDYAKPLDVRWLCQLHHIAWHTQNGEGKNPF